MNPIYDSTVYSYKFLVNIASAFNPKAKKWRDGQKNIIEEIKNKVTGTQKIAWFHCASLGEFEQGRPVIEKFRLQKPDYKILLTFFSPSGYEVRKNYDQADWTFYLPLDTFKNASKFLAIVKPEIAVFVKYEFWYNYLSLLKKNKVKTYSISAIFRPDQAFFKFYGGWYRSILKNFTHIFVQNQISQDLLERIGISQISLAGDTRFDRVFEIATNAKQLPIIDRFKAQKFLIVAGSSWLPDEELLARFINQNNDNLRFVIAPHEIHASNLNRIESLIKTNTVRYSQANEKNIATAKVMLIDNIGMLSSIYKYADISYIGGGFGVGIHNILEAATYGNPVVFGENYQKFKEAVDLIDEKGAFSISNFDELNKIFERLISDEQYLKNCGEIAANYVKNNKGATEKIIKIIAK